MKIEVLDPEVFTVKIVSFDEDNFHEATLHYLSGNHEYYDKRLGEHLYSSNVLEVISQLNAIPVRVALELTEVKRLCDMHGASYFRMINL